MRRLVAQRLSSNGQRLFFAVRRRKLNLQKLAVRPLEPRLEHRYFVGLRRHDIAEILNLALVMGQKNLNILKFFIVHFRIKSD